MLNASLVVIPPLFGWSVWPYNVYLQRTRSTSKTGLSWYSSYAYLFRVYSIYWSNSTRFKHLLAFKILFNHKEGIEDLAKEKIFSKEEMNYALKFTLEPLLVLSRSLSRYIYIYIHLYVCIYAHTDLSNLIFLWNLQCSGRHLALILEFLYKQWK